MLVTSLSPKSRLALIIVILTLLTSCGLSKKTLENINGKPKASVEFPVNYCNLFPTPTYEQWDQDYNYFNKFLTKEITKTQLGISTTDKNGVHTWWCPSSARPHVQLDTATMINDPDVVIGKWRAVCNRQIIYEDSFSYNDKKIYRSSRIVDDKKDDDLFLNLTAKKFKLFLRPKNKSSFRSITNQKYKIENKRFLMLYKFFKASSAISFIGLNKDDRLIINSFSVQERKINNTYVVYDAAMSQMIFSRL